MSAFLVGQKTLDLVALALHEHGKTTSEERRYAMDMNAEAIRQRYGRGLDTYDWIEGWHKDHMVPNIKRGRDLVRGLNDVGRAHLINLALRCYIYQCSEGTVPTKPLYIRLCGISEALQAQFPIILDMQDVDNDIYDWGE